MVKRSMLVISALVLTFTVFACSSPRTIDEQQVKEESSSSPTSHIVSDVNTVNDHQPYPDLTHKQARRLLHNYQ